MLHPYFFFEHVIIDFFAHLDFPVFYAFTLFTSVASVGDKGRVTVYTLLLTRRCYM